MEKPMHQFKRGTLFLMIVISFFTMIQSVAAQTPLVTAERKGGTAGTGTNGVYLYQNEKAMTITLNGQSLSEPIVDGKLLITIPRIVFPEMTYGTIALRDLTTSLTVNTTFEEDADNYYVWVPLETIGRLTRATIEVRFWVHNRQIVPDGFIFSPKVEVFAADKTTLLGTAAPMAAPFVLGNTPTVFYTSRNVLSSIPSSTNKDDNLPIFAGTFITSGATTFIDPNKTAPVAYYGLPHYANGETYARDSRVIASGTLHVAAPTYSCWDGTAAATCTAKFEAARSAGWTETAPGSNIFERPLTGVEDNPTYENAQTAWTSWPDAYASNPIYFTYPNAIKDSSTTTIMNIVDSLPINYDPTYEKNQPTTYTDSLISKIGGAVELALIKKSYSESIFDLNAMHPWDLNYYTILSNRNSAPLHIQTAVDDDFDDRIFLQEFYLPLDMAAHVTDILGIQEDGTEVSILASSNPFDSETSRRYTVESATKAAVDGQVAAVAGGTDPTTLPTLTRQYKGIKIVMDADFQIPAGLDRDILWSFKLTNPYQLRYTTYPSTASFRPCTRKDASPAPTLPANQNEFCNFTTTTSNLVLEGTNLTAEDLTSQKEANGKTWITNTPVTVSISDAALSNRPALQTYYFLGNRVNSTLNMFYRDVPSEYAFKNFKVIALLPPGANLVNPNPGDVTGTSGFYANPAELRAKTKAKTIVENYKNTGHTAVILEFEDFTRKEITDRTYFNFSFWLPFTIGKYSIPMQKVDEYKADNIARAGLIPDNDPNKLFFAYTYDGIKDFTLTDNFTKTYTATSPNTTPTTALERYLYTDSLDFDDDGNTTEKMLIASQRYGAQFEALSDAEKFIYTTGMDPQKTPLELEPETDFFYRFQTKNNAPTPLESFTLYDVLPSLNDKNYLHPTLTNPDRLSAFRPVLTGPVVPSVADIFDISYCTQANPPWDSAAGVAAAGCAWQATVADWSTVTAIQVKLAAGKQVQMFSFPYFTVPMRMPAEADIPDADGKTATNGFTLSYDNATNFAMSNEVVITAKIPYIIPTADVSAEKRWLRGAHVEPVTIHFQLYRQIGEEGTPAVVPGAAILPLEPGVLKVTWKDVEQTDADKQPYIFTVRETDAVGMDWTPPNYRKSERGLTVANAYFPPIKPLTATKVWAGNEPANVTHPTVYFRLYRQIGANGTPEAVHIQQAPLLELPNGTTSVTWDEIEMTNVDGDPYIFTVHETDADGVDTTPADYQKDESGLTVTNTYTKVDDPDLPGTGFPTRSQQPAPQLPETDYRDTYYVIDIPVLDLTAPIVVAPITHGQ